MAVVSVQRSGYGRLNAVGVAISLAGAVWFLVRAAVDSSPGSIGLAVGLVGLALLISTNAGDVFRIADDEVEIRRRLRGRRRIPWSDIERIQDWSGGVWLLHRRAGHHVQVPLHRMSNADEMRAAILGFAAQHQIPFEPLVE